MSSDAVTGVRQAAARAALLRTATPELVAAAKSAAQGDKSPHVRLAAVSVLERFSATQNELVSVLKDVAAKDPEETIRKEAKRIVAASEQGLLHAPG